MNNISAPAINRPGKPTCSPRFTHEFGKGAKNPINAARGRYRSTSAVSRNSTSVSIFDPASGYLVMNLWRNRPTRLLKSQRDGGGSGFSVGTSALLFTPAPCVGDIANRVLLWR